MLAVMIAAVACFLHGAEVAVPYFEEHDKKMPVHDINSF